jgi:proteasome component ECM29
MAEQELSLINKVELRIALANSDQQFQTALELYLCPLLLKLSSQHTSSRQAVLKFIQQLIPRLNGSRDVELPVLKLVEQAKRPNISGGADATSVQLYSLLLASKGIDRMQDKTVLVPTLLQDIEDYSGSVSSRLFNLFIRALQGWKTPDRGTSEFKMLQISLRLTEKTEKFLASKFESLFLLNPTYNDAGIIPKGTTCAGLSAVDVSFLTFDAGYFPKPGELSAVKKDVNAFLPLLQNENIVTTLLIGSEDSNDQVSNGCASMLRKVSIPSETKTFINHIISLFIGDKSAPRSPVKQTIQEAFLAVLSGSVIAAKHEQVSLISSMGLNATRFPRLKSATIVFIQWAAKHGEKETNGIDHLVTVAAQIKNNLHAEGWPRFEIQQSASFSTELKQRRLQYEALGEILRKDGSLLHDLAYINFLFDSLIGDIVDVRSSIQEALGGLMVHLSSLPDQSKIKLKALLKLYLESDVCFYDSPDAAESVRLVALKFVNATFPFDDSEARMLNVLGTSSLNRSDVIEEAQKGLHPYWFNILQCSNTSEFKSMYELLGTGNLVKFPSFESMVEDLTEAILQAKEKTDPTIKGALINAVEFTVRVLVQEAVWGESTVIVQDQEWVTRVDNALETDSTVIDLVKYFLKSSSSILNFLNVLLDNMTGVETGFLLSGDSGEPFGRLFTRLTSLCPNEAISSLSAGIPSLLSLTENQSILTDNLRYYASTSFGIISSHPSISDNQIHELLNNLIGAVESDARQSNRATHVLMLSSLASRLIFRRRNSLSPHVLKMILNIVTDTLKSPNSSVFDASISSLSQLAMFGALGPQLYYDFTDDFKTSVADILSSKVKKLDEKSIVALALVSLSEPESKSDELTAIETAIFDTSNTKQIETLFTSGEAISIIASGWSSKCIYQKIDIQDGSLEPLNAPREQRLGVILSKVLGMCASTKPSSRKAGCIWLLSLVQFCGHLAILKQRAGLIHVAFMRSLADKDELVQDAASRGLSMIYELGDSDLKETLVKGLLKSFTDSTSSNKLSAGSVSADTELFGPGVLKTNDGSVSTYKDVLSLASEVGDPSLVYKFMSMAKSSALWSSRKGIAFGLGSIMSKASLDKMIFENASLSNRLIPKLYRYRFDPSLSVSRSMNDIWSSLVPDTSITIAKYHVAILKELLKGMGSKEWRVREASTVALTDLVQTLPSEKYQDNMEEIWRMAFRSIDDIKESVRKAGGGLTRTLSKMLVNSIAVESGQSASKAHDMLTKLLPFLLGNKGILSDADDIRNFALQTLLALLKKAGSAIRPFIGELIEQLVLLMSTLEPQIINYLTLNADKYNLRSEDIDAKRMQDIGSSPMMNSLEKLIDLIDEDIIGDVIFRLQGTVKNSVGLPSKAAASRVIVMLIMRHLQLVQPYGETLLAICISQLKDRNSTVSSSFAVSAGYCCRVCSVDAVVKYADKIKNMYFNSEGDKTKIVAGIASEAVSKYSGDIFASVAGAFLPVAFIAKNDLSEEVAKAFDLEWSENTSGNGAVKLYMSEICVLVKEQIGSQQFSVRQVAAKSIANACNSLDSAVSASFDTTELFSVLLTACQGRSWAGKEDVLSALVSLVLKAKDYISENQELLEAISKTVIAEAKRRKKDYQIHAINSFALFASEYPSKELFDEGLEIFEPLFDEDYYESDEEDEMKSVNEKSSPKNLKREANQIRALSSLTTTFQIYSNFQYHEDFLLFALKCLIAAYDPKVYIPTWRSQIAIVEGLVKLATRLKGVAVSPTTELLLLKVWGASIENNLRSEDVENVKVQTVRAGKSLMDIGNKTLADKVIEDLSDLVDSEGSSVVKVEIKAVLQS